MGVLRRAACLAKPALQSSRCPPTKGVGLQLPLGVLAPCRGDQSRGPRQCSHERPVVPRTTMNKSQHDIGALCAVWSGGAHIGQWHAGMTGPGVAMHASHDHHAGSGCALLQCIVGQRFTQTKIAQIQRLEEPRGSYMHDSRAQESAIFSCTSKNAPMHRQVWQEVGVRPSPPPPSLHLELSCPLAAFAACLAHL